MNIKDDSDRVMAAYQQRAAKYDHSVNRFDIFARFGFNISGWRKQAVTALALKPGDTVVDVGCGTGLNFSLLHQAVTSGGKIIGVDLSEAMLAKAEQVAVANQWTNVELICADAAQFQFPSRVDAVLSTFALILVPDCERVVTNAVQALAPGGRLVVLDMAWPPNFPLWWRHVLFFLRAYGVTADTLRRRPWLTVQKSMAEQLIDISLTEFWYGFFYLAHGTAPGIEQAANEQSAHSL